MPFVTVISHQLWLSLPYVGTCANLHSFPCSDNGFVMLPSSMMTYNMSFTSQLAFSASDLEKQLLIRLDIHKPDTISHVRHVVMGCYMQRTQHVIQLSSQTAQ